MELLKSGEMNYLNPSFFSSFTFTPSAENVLGEKRVRINEVPLLHIVDDSKSSRTARVPSFYIGKPLADFDGSFTSVSRTQFLTPELTVTVRGECTQKVHVSGAPNDGFLLNTYWEHFLSYPEYF